MLICNELLLKSYPDHLLQVFAVCLAYETKFHRYFRPSGTCRCQSLILTLESALEHCKTRASQPSWGMQGSIEILFIEILFTEILFSDDLLSGHEDCPFSLHGTTLSAVPSQVNIAALCWGWMSSCWSEVLRDCNKRNKRSTPPSPPVWKCTSTPGLQCFYRPGLSLGCTSSIPRMQWGFFFCSVSAKKNLIIRMGGIHQNSLKIKYCSPLSHSEISVKQSLYYTFVYHQLEPSWEQNVICCFVRFASCHRSYTYFWSLGSFNISALEMKTLWHSFSLFAHGCFQEPNEKSKRPSCVGLVPSALYLCITNITVPLQTQ